MVGVMKTLRPALAFLGSMSVLVATEQKPILIQVPSRPPVFISAPFGDGLRPGSLRREPILVIQRCGQANVPAVDENGRPVHGTVPRILVRYHAARVRFPAGCERTHRSVGSGGHEKNRGRAASAGRHRW